MRWRYITAFIIFAIIVGGYIVFPGQVVAIIAVLSIVAVLPYYLWTIHRMRVLEQVTIENQGSRLFQKDPQGHTTAEINLEEDYEVSVPYVGFAEAIYRIKQNGQQIEFCTKTEGAKYLVTNVLKLKGEYPPVAPWNSGW